MRDMKDSGVEWLGKIPNHWTIQRIKNLFELRNERNYEALEDVNLISLYTDKGVVQHSDLSEKQKENKIHNILTALKKSGVIDTDSDNQQKSYWVLKQILVKISV